MPELNMPRLSDTMQEGTLAKWLKQPGERFEEGEVVAEIETDKATMPLEVYEAGVLEKILVQEGETAPIGAPIAVVGDGKGAAEQPAPAPDEARTAVAEREAPAPPERPPAPPRQEPRAPGKRVKASPMARAIARDRGVDLRTVQGTGPSNRVTRADVEAAAQAPRAAPAAGPPAAVGPLDEVEEVPMSNVRRITGRRMLESVQNAPHFYLHNVVDAEALLDSRKQLNAQLQAIGDDMKLTLTDLLVKACAIAIRGNPNVNVAFRDGKLLRYRHINIGVAVALKDGLIVPVIRDADQKSIGQIGKEAHALIDKARTGRLTPEEYTGGTFTISNLGMYGIDHFTAVINPPEAAILAVGAAGPEAVARDEQVVVRHTMKLSLSVDHRALDGATAAQFFQLLKGILEAPVRMLI